MKIRSLEINNILSIQKACIEFDDTGLVLIEGFNYDDDTANGAGKTAIMNALSFGLYGKFPRKVTVSNILRHGCKSGSVIIQEIQTNNGVWRVDRHRPTAVIYSKDGEVQDISQTEFEAALGLTYSQFLISMYSAQTSGESFIDMNDSAKKDFLLRLMNLDEFTSAKAIVDKEIKALEHNIQQCMLNESALVSRAQVYSESLVDTDSVNAQIDEMRKQINQCDDKILELSTVKKPDVSKYSTAMDTIATKRIDIRVAGNNKTQLVSQFKSLAQEYQHWNSDDVSGTDVACPGCNIELRLIDGTLIGHGDLIKMKEAKQIKALAIKEQCKQIKEKIDIEDKVIDKGDALYELETKIKREAASKSAEYDAACNRIAEVRAFSSQQAVRMQILENQLSEQKDRQKQLEQTKEILKIQQDDIKTRSEELELLRTVSHIYSPTGAPAYIMDSVLDAFNDSIAEYVSMIWGNASYSIQTFKENKAGDIKSKFSDKLILNGRDVSIGSLSGGQHRCLSLAVDFAMLDVLSDRFSIDINPVIFDEPLQGLDASNKERVLEVLEMIAAKRSVIIIEHSSEFKSAFSKTINVELRNGISTVVA